MATSAAPDAQTFLKRVHEFECAGDWEGLLTYSKETMASVEDTLSAEEYAGLCCGPLEWAMMCRQMHGATEPTEDVG